ncbi:MAG: N-acetylmuramoyl-L-alanine amidase [Chloroflexota bacterium]
MKIISNRLVLENELPAKFESSPNHGGPLTEKAFIVLHYTSETDISTTVSRFMDARSQVSAHILIGRAGEVIQFVPFNIAAWHAGISTWGSYNNLNAYSIGIELENVGLLQRSGDKWVSSQGLIYPDSEVLAAPHKSLPKVIYGWQKYTDIQIKTATEVVTQLLHVYGFHEIIGHDDIAPKRKWDPGPAFPMDQFRSDVAAAFGKSTPDPMPAPQPVPDPAPAPIPDSSSTAKLVQYKVENLDTGKVVEYALGTVLKPVVLLPVPYVSQLGTGADQHNNDCGATSAIMLMKAYFNLQMTSDEFYLKFNIPGDVYLSVVQLRNAMGSLGLLTDFRVDLTVPDLFGLLAAGKPPIVLLRYKVLSDAGLTEKKFGGPHFAVVVGLDIKNIYIHDPLYTNPEDGNAHAYPLDIFWKAWKDVALDTSFPNPERSALVPTAGIGFKLNRKVKVNQRSLNIRSGPGPNYQVVGAAKIGEVYEVSREMSGWGEIGENRWFVLAYTLPV